MLNPARIPQQRPFSVTASVTRCRVRRSRLCEAACTDRKPSRSARPLADAGRRCPTRYLFHGVTVNRSFPLIPGRTLARVLNGISPTKLSPPRSGAKDRRRLARLGVR